MVVYSKDDISQYAPMQGTGLLTHRVFLWPYPHNMSKSDDICNSVLKTETQYMNKL